jgi:hypothetical protein
MSFYLYQADAFNNQSGQSKSISTLSGNVVTATTTWFGGARPEVGEVLRLTGTSFNDGWYTIIQLDPAGAGGRPASFDNIAVEPSLTAESGSGTAALITNQTTKIGSVAADKFLSGNRIRIAESGATSFETSDVQLNDRVMVRSTPDTPMDGVTGNDGAWFVNKVDSFYQLTVRNLTGSPDLAVISAANSTLDIVQGGHTISAIDEFYSTFSDLESKTVPLPHPTIFGSHFGAGPITNFIQKSNYGSNKERTLYECEGLNRLSIEHDDSRTAEFTIEKECLLNKNTTSLGVFLFSSPTTLINIINIGDSPGNRAAGRFGSYVAGFNLDSTIGRRSVRTDVRASMWDNGSRDLVFLSDCNISGSVVSASSWVHPAQGFTGGLNEAVSYNAAEGAGAGFGVSGVGLDQANFLVQDQVSAGFLASGAVVTELLKSDVVPTPMALAFGAVTFKNPREDYDLADLITNFAGTSTKLYTWNPRFVERTTQATVASPIANLLISIFDVNETTGGESEISGSPFLTDSNGRIGASGEGIDLTRSTRAPAGTTEFNQRILIEGPAIVPVNQIITMRAKLDFDFPVDLVQTDFEGEFNI